MKLNLYIQGKKVDTAGVCFVSTDIYTKHLLLKKSIELMKLRNKWLMKDKEWEMFLTYQSKME